MRGTEPPSEAHARLIGAGPFQIRLAAARATGILEFVGKLVIIGGNDTGTSFDLGPREMIIGRQSGAEIKLNGTNVSRRHARIMRDGERFLLEDLNSSNGTFLNGTKLLRAAPLKPRDEIRIGPYLLRFESGAAAPQPDLTIHARTLANTENIDLYKENPARKLKIILELTEILGRSLDPNELLPELLAHLFELFPHAERGIVVLMVEGKPVLRAQKVRPPAQPTDAFSRSILQKVTGEATGVLASDLHGDARFAEAQSLCALKLHSLICVPLRTKSAQPFGALQLERSACEHSFTAEDLNLLTAIGLQVSVALENARLHQELLARHRLEREIALAREIQAGYLPREVPPFTPCTFDLHAELFPAYEISGDFYDYFKLGEDRLVLAVADVSGKGMPAALFMSMVRALLRNLAEPEKDAGSILRDLNNAVAAQNPSCQFVTVHLSIYHCHTRQLQFASAGHPPSLLRRRDGSVETLDRAPGPLLGFTELPGFATNSVTLDAGDLLLLYTDGITEAPDARNEMFGLTRLRQTIGALELVHPLPDCAAAIRKSLHAFTGASAQEDDITLALLRVC